MLNILILKIFKQLRAMEDGLFNGPSSWSNFQGPTSYKNSFESLGPSLGLNRIWTKKNGHAPNSQCADFY